MSNDAHRVTLAQLGEFLTQLGIDWTPETIHSIVMKAGQITVTRNRRDEQGRKLALPATGEF